jgi:hypothetical protein
LPPFSGYRQDSGSIAQNAGIDFLHLKNMRQFMKGFGEDGIVQIVAQKFQGLGS